jgi:hypothetical protein
MNLLLAPPAFRYFSSTPQKDKSFRGDPKSYNSEPEAYLF